ncbi:MAG: efflux transporter outer membrane subunit [Pseudomonadota bacterium]
MRRIFAGTKVTAQGCVLVPMVFVLAGCASMDVDLTEQSLPEIPERWAGAEKIDTDGADMAAVEDRAGLNATIDEINDIPTGDWVGSFGDDALHGLIAEAMVHNNNLQAAVRNLAAARSNVKVTRSALFPTLNADGSAGRIAAVGNPLIAAQAGGGNGDLAGLDASDLEDQFGVDRDGDGRLDGLDFDGDGFAEAQLPDRRIYINSYQLQARINWELDVWGRIRDETKAAYGDATATLADLDGARLSVASSVAQAWFNLIEARLQRELADRTFEARQSNLRITERRYERGVASSLDVRLSRSQVASDQSNLLLRRQQEAEASRRLEVLLGRYPGAEIEAASRLPELPSLEGAGAPGDVLARRPDILAAEARMEAAGLRARAARKQLLPQLSISANVNTSGPVLADVIDPERLAGNLFSSIAQPIFQGGRLRANAKRAKAQAEAAIFTYTQTALAAYEEAENALAAEVFLAGREAALKLAYEEAAAGEALTERRYNSGAASIFNLLDAQTRRIAAESQYINAQSQRVRNRVQLYLAIGGNFITDPGLFAEPQTVSQLSPSDRTRGIPDAP